jgi:hypothetical protein
MVYGILACCVEENYRHNIRKTFNNIKLNYQEFIYLVKILKHIDRKYFDNQEYLNYLFSQGLRDDLFVPLNKKNYISRPITNSYYRRLEITKLILVRTLYFWYSNSKC